MSYPESSRSEPRPIYDELRERRVAIPDRWGLDDGGSAPIWEHRDLRGDEWLDEAELGGIEFLLRDES